MITTEKLIGHALARVTWMASHRAMRRFKHLGYTSPYRAATELRREANWYGLKGVSPVLLVKAWKLREGRECDGSGQ